MDKYDIADIRAAFERLARTVLVPEKQLLTPDTLRHLVDNNEAQAVVP